MGNIGYTIVGEPRVGGITQARRNVWFVSTAQQWQVTPKTKLLSEIYLETADEPGQSNRFAADVGFEHKLRDKFQSPRDGRKKPARRRPRRPRPARVCRLRVGVRCPVETRNKVRPGRKGQTNRTSGQTMP